MSDNGHNEADISRLNIARQAAYDLARLQRQAAELPALEAAEADRQRQAEAAQREGVATAKFERLLAEYRPAKLKRNLELVEACHQLVDAIRRLRTIDDKGSELRRLAEQMAAARIERGHAPWSFTNDQALNRLTLQSGTEQIMSEYQIPQLTRISSPYNGPEIEALLSLVCQFVDVSQAAKPTPVTDGRVLLVDHDGNNYWG